MARTQGLHGKGRESLRRFARVIGGPALGPLSWVIVASTFVVSYVSVVRTRSLFTPDSVYYVGMALRFAGWSETDAFHTAVATPLANGWHPPDQEMMFGWGLVQPRVVLPLLSAPFTAVFGIYGTAVVTGLATALLVWLLTRMMASRLGAPAAVVSVLLVVTSELLMYFGVAMLTESLTALWAALILATTWRYQETPRRSLLLILSGLTLLSAFTRQATFIVAGALVVAWLGALILRQPHRPWRAPALVVAGTALAAQLTQALVFPTFSQTEQFLQATGTATLMDALRATPRLAWHIVKAELRAFMVGDRPLLMLVVLSLLSMVVLWRRSSSHLLAGALIGIALYNITNGTPTQFRYEMPGLVFFVFAVAALVSRALGGRAAEEESGSAPADEERPRTGARRNSQPRPQPSS